MKSLKLWADKTRRADMRQRIIVHTPEPVSSPALYVHELTRALTQEGIPVHVVCPKNHQALDALKANPLITVHPTAARSLDPRYGLIRKTLTNSWFLLSCCAVILRETRPGDIIHFQYNLHFPFGSLFFVCARLQRAMIVFTVHDPVPHKWMMPKWLRWAERGALAWSYKTSNTLIVHSEAGKRALEQHFQQDAAKIKVIVHGPYELGAGHISMPRSEYLEVLLFGALRENKGPHLAIGAVQQLHREGFRVRLTIAGSVLNRKEQDYWTRCRELIGNYPEPIRLIEKFIPDVQLPELFGRCHCFLLPYTQFSSDSGVAFMALANGRAIISTRSGGLEWLLEASGGGMTIEEPTVEAVAAALRTAASLGPEYLDQMGIAGRAWVLEECGWPKVARETRRLYEHYLKPIEEINLPVAVESRMTDEGQKV
jgi:glycogen synthase